MKWALFGKQKDSFSGFYRNMRKNLTPQTKKQIFLKLRKKKLKKVYYKIFWQFIKVRVNILQMSRTTGAHSNEFSTFASQNSKFFKSDLRSRKNVWNYLMTWLQLISENTLKKRSKIGGQQTLEQDWSKFRRKFIIPFLGVRREELFKAYSKSRINFCSMDSEFIAFYFFGV